MDRKSTLEKLVNFAVKKINKVNDTFFKTNVKNIINDYVSKNINVKQAKSEIVKAETTHENYINFG